METRTVPGIGPITPIDDDLAHEIGNLLCIASLNLYRLHGQQRDQKGEQRVRDALNSVEQSMQLIRTMLRGKSGGDLSS